MTKENNLYEDLIKGTNSTGQQFTAIPAFTKSGGMVRRQCTAEYKIKPVIKKLENYIISNQGNVCHKQKCGWASLWMK